VIVREATLNDAAVAALLREKFVPMAIDNVDFPNQTADERDFLIDKGWTASTNGQSAFTADGRLLGTGYFFDPRELEKFLLTALERFEKGETAPGQRKRTPPEEEMRTNALKRKLNLHFPSPDILVANLTWKVTGDYGRAEGNSTSAGDKYAALFQNSVGVDRLWITPEEQTKLAGGEWPESVTRRLASMLAYLSGTKRDSVKPHITVAADGVISGTWTGADGKPGSIKGTCRSRDGKITSLLVLAQGAVQQVRDCGFSANLQTIPRGRHPQAALLMELADPSQPMHRVTPYHATAHNYFE
jgi:hypothetical protein